MATYTGQAGQLSIGGALIAQLTTWTLETTAEPIENSVIGSTWRTYKGGMKGYTLSGEGYYDVADPGQNKLQLGDLVGFVLQPAGATEGERQWDGNTLVTAYSESASFDGMISFTFSLQGTGPLGGLSTAVPTTLDPLYTGPLVTLDQTLLVADFNASLAEPESTRSTTSKSAGKWCYEVVNTYAQGAADSTFAGICVAGQEPDKIPGFGNAESSKGYGLQFGDWEVGAKSYLYNASTRNDIAPTSWDSAGEVIMICVDIDAGTLSYVLGAGLVQIASNLPAETWFAALGGGGVNNILTVNFGGSAFTNTVPPGYSAWGA